MRGGGLRPGLAIVLALVTGATFAGSLDGAFVLDDLPNVRDNPRIAALDAAHLREIFRSFDDANYIPLKVLSLAVDRWLWGPEPFGFHLTNVLLHVGCAEMVYVILLRLGLGTLGAFTAALLWAIHPLQVESVAWISERKNVLSGFFFFAAFATYLRYSDSGRVAAYLGLLALFVLALLSKMNTMVLPAVCLAYEATFRFRLRRRDLLATLPMFALAALVGWYNLADNPIHGAVWHGGSARVTWLSSAVVVWRYLGLIVAPAGLSPAYAVVLRDSAADPIVALALAGIAAGLGAIALLVATRRREAFWLLWFGITLAPMLNLLVPFLSMMQDRFMYLSLLGPVALVVSLAGSVPLGPLGRGARAAVATAGVVTCALLSVRQIEIWKGPLTVWGRVAATLPYPAADGPPPEIEARRTILRGLLASAPRSAPLRNNLGALAYAEGDWKAAIAILETAANLAPRDATIATNLGSAYMRAGRLAEARRVLERATALGPFSMQAHLALARVHLALGELVGAREALEACARLRPDPGAARAWRAEAEELARRQATAAPRP